ncbi:Retinoic acid induced 16-like protein-domain-containing protein [Pilaira anomala]|nr:Retinoic acid induced 16-like protein-domain-containing protein [Pilaira anomala]
MPEYEFLLFTYLLRFVHREGRSGDFARTGLLFLMEMATGQLGDFILESDFATIMSAGLGALYSQLPRKLIIKDENEINSSPASYLLGQDTDPRMFPSEEVGVEQSNSAQFKYQLDSFLKLLEFCQDILLRCPNDAISERLLQCIRMIFLENILYPSILECSDIDGSSVAVVSYIDIILQTVQQQDLAFVIVGFLMDASNDELIDDLAKFTENTTTTSLSSNTHNLFSGVEFDRFKSSPYFTAAERFTLKDLIFSRLKSSSQPTVIATLKLLKTLIVKHCRFANRLLSTVPENTQHGEAAAAAAAAAIVPPPPPSTIISHHIREIELYFSLISAMDQVHANDILTLGYQDYLRDMEMMMDQDCCFQQATEQPETSTSKSERRRSFKYGQRSSSGSSGSNALDPSCQQGAHEKKKKHTILIQQRRVRHRIRPTDTLIQILLGLLSHFFAQSSELNLALTGVISALAICPYRSLEGWISFSESDRTHANDVLNLTTRGPVIPSTDEEHGGIRGQDIYALSAIKEQEREQGEDDDQSIDFGADRNSIRMTAPTQFKSFPPFYTLFRTLTQQIDYYRSEVDGFDGLLDERWNGLLFGESSMAYGVPGTPIPSSSSSTRRATHGFGDSQQQGNKVFGGGGGGGGGGGTQQQQQQQHQPQQQRRNSLSVSKNNTTTAPIPPTPSKSLSSSTITTTAAVAAAVAVVGTMTSTSSSNLANQPQTLQSQSPIINPLSPLAIHAKKTTQVRIQPLFPSNFEIERDEPILNLDEEDEDTFAPRPSLNANPSERKKMDKSTEISLSMLLNNVVILEETIKELVAIMQVRRSLGIDSIRYT